MNRLLEQKKSNLSTINTQRSLQIKLDFQKKKTYFSTKINLKKSPHKKPTTNQAPSIYIKSKNSKMQVNKFFFKN